MSLREAIARRATNDELPCVAAVEIAEEGGAAPTSMSKESSAAGVRISQCQLGLFGYQAFGEKRIAGRLETVPEPLLDALQGALVNGAVPCAAAWKIADDAGIPRLLVGAAANTLGIRIAPCQLGCF